MGHTLDKLIPLMVCLAVGLLVGWAVSAVVGHAAICILAGGLFAPVVLFTVGLMLPEEGE